MPSYTVPGVYVEEMPPAVRPIAGVGTSTPAFIGVVDAGIVMPAHPDPTKTFTVFDAGKPKLVTSWEEYQQLFGKYDKANAGKDMTLAHAVFGFFYNGGTSCYVMRVAAAADLTDLKAELAKLEPIDDISIVAVPGATTKAQHGDILGHCAAMKDRVAVLDGLQNPTAITDPDEIAPEGRSEAGSYGAVYFPYLKVLDPVTEKEIHVPPSGHVAGVYARSDATRGVFKAPANEQVLGVLGVEHLVSHAQQDKLNPKGVNVIRVLNGTIKVWGARTRTDDAHPEWRYLSTRRYFNFVRESIDEGLQWVVFEPNSPALWQRISRNVSDFLLGQWRDGALFGETPAKAFYVKCDADTNPSQVRELGQVVTEIGIAIVKPAEFVIFRIQQQTGS